MKKTITIPQNRQSFTLPAPFPLVAGDVNAYEVVLPLSEDAAGAQLTVQAKRANNQVVTDMVQINGTEARYTLKSNMYDIAGGLFLRLQVVQDGSILSECQLDCEVLEAYGSDVTADDRLPVLSSAIAQTQEAAAAANGAAQAANEAAEAANEAAEEAAGVAGRVTALEHNTTLIQNSGGGFAAGTDAEADTGAAIGADAKAGAGFAGGKSAKAVDSSGGGIDAIQLGTGTNSVPKTLQAYGYQLMDANGKIPDARLNDAPGDGTLYGRKDGGWEELTSLHTHANKAVLDATEVAYTENEQARIGTLESDLDTFYTDLNDLQNTAVTDAPSDGNTYARKDGAWSAISTGGGMATLSWDEMDDFEKGIATVTRSYTTTDTGSGTHYSDVCLLIAGSFYITYNGAQDGPAQRRQALIYPDGKIMTRITDYNSGQWNEWKEYVPSAS